MARRQVGVVKELFRYPVKSMLGEELREVDIGQRGVIGDRAYTLREANGRVVTAMGTRRRVPISDQVSVTIKCNECFWLWLDSVTGYERQISSGRSSGNSDSISIEMESFCSISRYPFKCFFDVVN